MDGVDDITIFLWLVIDNSIGKSAYSSNSVVNLYTSALVSSSLMLQTTKTTIIVNRMELMIEIIIVRENRKWEENVQFPDIYGLLSHHAPQFKHASCHITKPTPTITLLNFLSFIRQIRSFIMMILASLVSFLNIPISFSIYSDYSSAFLIHAYY